MPQPNKRFLVSAKIYYLTYPRCSLSIQEALDQLQLILAPTSKKFIRVSRELQEDGEPHLHVLIQFESKFICMNQRTFDLVSPTRSTHFHPNIQGAKSSSDVKAYIDKDGDYSDWGEFQVDGRSARGGGGKQTIADVYAEALNSGNKDSALQIIKEKKPEHFVLQFRKMNSKLDRFFAPPPSVFISNWDPSSFRVPYNLQKWVGDNVFEDPAARPDRPISIIIEGRSRIGKTEWARSLGAHNYLHGYIDFNAEFYGNDVMYNVIDNVNPKFLAKKQWRELIGCKKDWQIKYGRKQIMIRGGVPSIVLCNPDESYRDFLEKKANKALKDWTLQNAWFEFIEEPLYQQRSNQEGSPQQG